MRIARLLFLSLLSLASISSAQSPGLTPADIERQVIRGIDNDAALPRDAEEYEATGKNAVLMLDSRTAVSTELPLRAVYLIHQSVRIPLQRLALGAKRAAEDGRTHQVSFYLIPVHYMKLDSLLVADFAGQRTGFGITSFSPMRGEQMPAFVRLDEYDAPQDPNTKAVAELLAREFPGQAAQLVR